MQVAADVDGDAFAEVTFQARAAGDRWRSIGTDDNRPFRVFHDTAAYDPRTPVRYRAVVADNNGHARMSDVRRTEVPSPSVEVVSPPAAARSPGSTRSSSRRRSTPSGPRSGSGSSAASTAARGSASASTGPRRGTP